MPRVTESDVAKRFKSILEKGEGLFVITQAGGYTCPFSSHSPSLQQQNMVLRADPEQIEILIDGDIDTQYPYTEHFKVWFCTWHFSRALRNPATLFLFCFTLSTIFHSRVFFKNKDRTSR